MVDWATGSTVRAGVTLAAVAAMMVFTAAPAFGQEAGADDENNATGEDRFDVICPQVVTVFVNQSNYGDANAVAISDSEAAAVVAQQFDISVAQVNECLSGAGGGDVPTGEDQHDDGNGDGNGSNSDETGPDGDTTGPGGDTTGPNGDDSGSNGDVIDDTVPDQPLPNTGGSLLLPVAALLLASGIGLRDSTAAVLSQDSDASEGVCS